MRYFLILLIFCGSRLAISDTVELGVALATQKIELSSPQLLGDISYQVDNWQHWEFGMGTRISNKRMFILFNIRKRFIGSAYIGGTAITEYWHHPQTKPTTHFVDFFLTLGINPRPHVFMQAEFAPHLGNYTSVGIGVKLDAF